MHAHRAPYHAAIQQYMKDNAPAARKETIQQTLETYLQTFGLTDRQFEGLRHLVSGNNLTNALYQRLNKVSKATATRDLQEMVCSGVLKLTGKGAGGKIFYCTPGTRWRLKYLAQIIKIIGSLNE